MRSYPHNSLTTMGILVLFKKKIDAILWNIFLVKRECEARKLARMLVQ
jgi:hypothetical protein